MMRIDLPSPPQRILLIKPSALGDIVHALPILNLLRRRWPEARISWLIARPFANLIERHPQVDEVIVFDRRRYGQGWRSPRAAMGLARFIKDLYARHFDLVIDLQGLFRSGWLSAITRAPVRVGFSNARELAHLFYTHHVRVESMEQHAIDRYLSVAEALGCGREPVEFRFAVDDADRRHIDEALRGIGPFAVLLPGTNWITKRWPPERFAELIGPLRGKHALATVLAGGNDVVDLSRQVPATLNLAGKTTLRQLVALLERADLVIANDSGPMHIAAALGRPLVTVFGPTNPIRTGPFRRPDSVLRVQIPCSPCYSRRCCHISCMRLIEPADVLAAAQAQVAASGQAPVRA